ncbi:MAG: APC family permease [Bryobacter sp.]|nr:APC family permease [Bryobacter sp.]
MSSEPVRLNRSLGLWQLLVMGVIMVQPTAPMPPFGAISAASGGHAVTTILVAMFAMMLTALNYGRMARVYPFAGSAYTYVAREIHPAAGFLTGWSLLLDYIVNPVICTIWCAKAVIGLFPGVPYAAGVLFFALLFTMLNLRGIQATARTNEFLAAAMGIVVLWMVWASVRYLAARGPVTLSDLLLPFYDPTRFTLRELSTGASVAVPSSALASSSASSPPSRSTSRNSSGPPLNRIPISTPPTFTSPAARAATRSTP